MAKRFTDTGKWKRPWFRALSMQAKVLWQYICDDCDHAGIWIADFDLVTFQVGFRVDEAILKRLLGTKIVRLNGEKFFIPSFFEFQYAETKDGFKAKQSALKILKSFGLTEPDSDCLRDLTNSYLTVPDESVDCHIISKSISKIKSNTGSAEGAATPADYEAAYQKYPKKVGKSDGLAKLKKLCPLKNQLDEFEMAMEAYVAKCKANETFFKQFDSFVNSPWRDCLDPTYGHTEPLGVEKVRGIAEILADEARGVS